MQKSSGKDIPRFVSVLVTLLLMGILATCSPSMLVYRLYQDSEMPSDETAQIFCKGKMMQINSVNGMKSPDGKNTIV